MATVDAPPEEVLLQRPWLPVSISGCQLLAKSWFGETTYHILLSDLHCVWEEKMDAGAIQSRAQELNKRLRAPVKAFFSHLREVVQPFLSEGGAAAECEAQMSLARQEDGNISLRLKSELAGLPFYWQFHCTPAPVTLVCVQLVRPLLAMTRLLQQQVDQLGGLLVRKDAEIQDYRENGATLTRGRLQTDPFEEQRYREDFMVKALPVQDLLGLDADLQQLYGAVVAHQNVRKRKASPEEPEAQEEEEEEEEEEGVASSPAAETESSSRAANGDTTQSHNDSPGAKMADEQTVRQPAERAPSKPKKKKVGLFR